MNQEYIDYIAYIDALFDSGGKQNELGFTMTSHSGHILANRLGGPGNKPINIFPQDLSINRGSYAQFEDTIYQCIIKGVNYADLYWTFTYASTNQTKPIKVSYRVVYTGGNCTSIQKDFLN